MNQRVSGTLILLFPSIIWGILEIFGLEFFWFLNENFKYYDLVTSFISFTIMAYGLWLIARKNRLSLVLSLWIFFFFKHAVLWDFYGNRYLSKVTVSPNVDIALIVFDLGGLASSNSMTLEKFERRFFIFAHRKTLKHYVDIKNATVYTSGDSVVIDIQHFDNTVVSESIEVSGI